MNFPDVRSRQTINKGENNNSNPFVQAQHQYQKNELSEVPLEFKASTAIPDISRDRRITALEAGNDKDNAADTADDNKKAERKGKRATVAGPARVKRKYVWKNNGVNKRGKGPPAFVNTPAGASNGTASGSTFSA
jgi:hypothetical protein